MNSIFFLLKKLTIRNNNAEKTKKAIDLTMTFIEYGSNVYKLIQI